MQVTSPQPIDQFRLLLQQGRFPSRDNDEKKFIKKISTQEDNFDYVYDIYKLPEGFRAEFRFGVFGYGDVDKLSDYIKDAFPGKELKLVKLSELDGEAYSFDRQTCNRISMLAENTYILLVEDPEFNNSLEYKLYKALVAAKQEVSSTCED